jgi:hypothetical protein
MRTPPKSNNLIRLIGAFSVFVFTLLKGFGLFGFNLSDVLIGGMFLLIFGGDKINLSTIKSLFK